MATEETRSEHSIADVLRESIRQRMLPPGMALIQQSIADAMGVSRIPVREALQRLASEGLVTFGDDGARVTQLTPPEIDELWSLRAVLEPAMAEAISENATEEDIEELRALVEDMDTVGHDVDAWSNLNYAFHDRLYRASHLEHFRTAARRVLTMIEPYSRVAAGLLAQLDVAQAEHRQMLVAIEDRDPDRLRDILATHSIRAREKLVTYAQAPADDEPGGGATSAARRLADRLVPDS
ncbi:MAG: GntR family transcriptional regulator [Gaiella sp.]